MPRILDNISEHLCQALLETLAESRCLDASVGYFNLRGWDAICREVENLESTDARPSVRLLIGMQDRPHSQLRDELRIVGRAVPMDNQTATRLRKVAAAELREQLTWGIPRAADEVTLRMLKCQLAKGKVRVKLHLAHLLHAKLYLCHLYAPVSPRCCFVGSSNLTFAGMSGQGELNIDVIDHDATKKLEGWFEDRWNDRFSLDITDELVEILAESWASERVLDPYLIHLRIAYHLSRDAREGLVEFGLPESMQRQLLEYQAAAVKITARNLMTRGGAMVGDVVGLGKTIIATAVALVLQEEHGYEALIVCPKNLVPMWESYVDTYRLHAKVVSLSMVHKDLENLRRHRLVIVDESHNLRNPKRRDYMALRDYITSNDPKVLLLTATPYNTSMSDVASQLGLFVDDDVDLGVRPEAAIEQQGEAKFFARCDDKPSTLKAFSLSEEPEDWQRLLSQFLIRRTRRFIRDNYAVLDEESGRHYLLFGDGTRHFLPDRVPRPLHFEIANGDPASDMESQGVVDAIDSLHLPRYDLGRYVSKAGPKPNPDEQQVLARLERAGGNLLGFTRTMLMKRLSSSGAVFVLSLQRHLLRNQVYAEAIQQNRLLPVGNWDGVLDGMQMVGGDASDVLDDLEDFAAKNVLELRPALFTDSLRDALEADIAVIGDLLERFGSWNEATDTKLDALQELLAITHRDEKVLIFSEYADSARYVAEALKHRGISRIESVTGDSENPLRLARRFSPRSNAELPGAKVSAADELRILVATDVLSEGQNLQDAAIVVNWDLPWAIIKLIQRAGRVDRIGQRAERVVVYTFLPTDGVEAVLNLRDRVAKRLAKNAAVFGSDERFLNTPDESRIIRALFSEDQEVLDGGDTTEQVDYASAAYEIWRNAEINHPELARAARDLPDVNYATQSDSRGEPGALVYTLSSSDVDRIGFTPLEGPARRLSPIEALELSECTPQTPGLEPLSNHHELVQTVVEGPLAPTEFSAEGALTGVRRRLYQRVRDYVDESAGQLLGPDVTAQEAVAAIHRFPLTEHAKELFKRALRERTPEDLLGLVVSLHQQGRLSVDTTSEAGDVRIVCSMGFAPNGSATAGDQGDER